MNEFIVWDEDGKCWVPNHMCGISSGATLLTREDSEEFADCYIPDWIDVEICNYIGKTDIEDNKIYADSSIVKVSVFDDHSGEETVYVDYVTFDKKQLRYVLSKSREFNFAIFADEIKIIGTLQENKELLK
jgi:hypothetical protein